MYLDLYRGLNLKPKDLTVYDSPLVSFDGKVVIPKGQIRLLVQAGSEVVENGPHCGGCILSLHGHYGQTLTSCPGGRFFYSAFEIEVSIRGSD